MNREIVRLLAYLKEPAANTRIIAQLQDHDLPAEEKLHARAAGPIHSRLDDAAEIRAVEILRDGPHAARRT